MNAIIFSHVYVARGVVLAWVTTKRGAVHKVGHLPREGWFCTCSKGRRCPQIDAIKAMVPVAAVELGARNVEAGTTPAGACTPTRQAVP